jgi:hypothetical protein
MKDTTSQGCVCRIGAAIYHAAAKHGIPEICDAGQVLPKTTLYDVLTWLKQPGLQPHNQHKDSPLPAAGTLPPPARPKAPDAAAKGCCK